MPKVEKHSPGTSDETHYLYDAGYLHPMTGLFMALRLKTDFGDALPENEKHQNIDLANELIKGNEQRRPGNALLRTGIRVKPQDE